MPTFVLRLIAPRPNFAETLTDSEREVMNRHAAHWRPYLERGDMVVFGPVLTDEDSYGLAVVETDNEQALCEFAAQDPVVTTGTAAFEFGRLAAGRVRGRRPGVAERAGAAIRRVSGEVSLITVLLEHIVALSGRQRRQQRFAEAARWDRLAAPVIGITDSAWRSAASPESPVVDCTSAR